MNRIEFEDMSYLSKDRFVDLTGINLYSIPLVINNSTELTLLVKKGSKVKKNQPIAKSEKLDFSIVSPVSGVVDKIDECIYLDGRTVPCINIEKKGRQPKEVEIKDISNYTKEEFLETLKKYSVSSMGGGNFPTFIKYDCLLSTLIVNAVECEPYITADYALAKQKYLEIIETINAIMKINNIRNCYIAINSKYTDLITLYSENALKFPRINIVSAKDSYPIGWEKDLVKEITQLDYVHYPQEKGVVVNNISTIYSIYEALKFNTCTDKRIVTISGERVKEPFNALLNIGTNITDILDKIELINGESIKYVAGGPIMGRALPKTDLIVTPNLNSILFIDDIEDKKIYPCFRCGKCIEYCPAKIAPVLIKDNMKNVYELRKLDPQKCIECGICSYICPSNIDVRSFVKRAKREVEK